MGATGVLSLDFRLAGDADDANAIDTLISNCIPENDDTPLQADTFKLTVVRDADGNPSTLELTVTMFLDANMDFDLVATHTLTVDLSAFVIGDWITVYVIWCEACNSLYLAAFDDGTLIGVDAVTTTGGALVPSKSGWVEGNDLQGVTGPLIGDLDDVMLWPGCKPQTAEFEDIFNAILVEL